MKENLNDFWQKIYVWGKPGQDTTFLINVSLGICRFVDLSIWKDKLKQG